MKTSSRAAVVAFVVALVSTVLIGLPVAVKARWIRVQAATCSISHYAKTEQKMNLIYPGWGAITNFNGPQVEGGDNNAHIFCSLADSDLFPHTSLNGVNVHVYDGANSSRSSAQVCAIDHNSSDPAICTTVVSTTDAEVGERTLQPVIAPIAGAPSGHFVSARIILFPSYTTGLVQIFRGLYATTP